MNKLSIKKGFTFACGILVSAPLMASYGLANQESDEMAPPSNKIEFIKYGNLDSWITRNVKESGIIGGKTKALYEIAPTATWNETKAYTNQGGSPWATSNVLAKVCGITKTNTSVYKEARPGNGYCARLETHIEKCAVFGIVDIKVLAAGSIYLGAMLEPVTSTSKPMSKINAGIPFNRKPKAVCFDYKVKLSGIENRIKQTGFSHVSQVKGIDMADCVLCLQKRWEDAKGNIHASRIATMVTFFNRNTNGWVNNAQFPIHYGNITGTSYFHSFMALQNGEEAKYAMNSKGQMVPIQETAWGNANDTPTHLLLQFSSSHGGAYIGSPGNTLWVDNIRLVY
ncbi:MAG: PCMD domain-containing protein [Bacteroidaceae bacterium]